MAQVCALQIPSRFPYRRRKVRNPVPLRQNEGHIRVLIYRFRLDSVRETERTKFRTPVTKRRTYSNTTWALECGCGRVAYYQRAGLLIMKSRARSPLSPCYLSLPCRSEMKHPRGNERSRFARLSVQLENRRRTFRLRCCAQRAVQKTEKRPPKSLAQVQKFG